MKKLSLVLVVAILFTSLNSIAKKDPISKGFNFNLYAGIPGSTYGLEKDCGAPSSFSPNAISGIQIGNRWYFAPTKKFGVGLKVNWLDLSYGASDASELEVVKVLDMSALGLGPVGSIGIGDHMAIDAYYQLRPTLLTSRLEHSEFIYEMYDGFGMANSIVKTSFGLASTIGIAFRYRILNMGFEYLLGGVKSIHNSGSIHPYMSESPKLQTNSLRINLGLKF